MRLAALALLLASAPAVAAAEDVAVTPAGVYGEIDTRLAIETLVALVKGPPEERDLAVAEVKRAPQRYAPPVFYGLSKVLLDRGDEDGAAFWFYAGQLRGRTDANLCLDRSASSGIAALNEAFGPAINRRTFQDRARLAALVERVVAWDRATPHDYDRRWIALHGMDAMTSSMPGGTPHTGPVSIPKERWDEVSEQTRRDYLAAFKKVLADLQATPGDEAP
jgi:hypothetical protein